MYCEWQNFLAKRIPLAGAFALVIASSACAPVVYVDPVVSLDLTLQSEDYALQSANETYLLDDSALRAQSSEDHDQGLPWVQSIALSPEEYCFVINVTGAGLTRAFFDSTGQCEQAFPGLGKLSTPFEWNKKIKPEIEVSMGSRRFDVIAFKKEIFGGNCPNEIRAEQNADGSLFFVDGQKRDFPAGHNAPLKVAAHSQKLTVGENRIQLPIKGLGSKLVSEPYGCREFKIFPEPDSENLVTLGSVKPFFDVECPNDAKQIQIQVGKYKPTIEQSDCSPLNGRAIVQMPGLEGYDSYFFGGALSSPPVQISAWTQAGDKVASKSFQVRIRQNSSYEYVRDPEGAIMEFETTASEDVFWIREVTEKFIKIGIGSTQSGQSYEVEISRQPGDSKNSNSWKLPLLWSGADLDETLMGTLTSHLSNDILIADYTRLDSNFGSSEFFPPWEDAFIQFKDESLLKPGIWIGKKKIQLRNQRVAGGAASITDENGLTQTHSVLYRSPDAGKSWYRVFVGQEGGVLFDAHDLNLDTMGIYKGLFALEHYPERNNMGALTGKKFLRIVSQKIGSNGF